MEKSLHVKGLRETLKLFASISKEHQIIFPRYGKYPFADAFSVTIILFPCSNVKKTHWIAVFHWYNLGFVVGHTNHLWGQTNPAALMWTKTETFQEEYPGPVCSKPPDSCLCCTYVLGGVLSSLWHGWMSTWKTWHLSKLGAGTRWTEWKLFPFVFRTCGSRGRWACCFTPGKGRWASTGAGVEWPLAEFLA